MLPCDHPAVSIIKRLCSHLPKFNSNTPVPYSLHHISFLHKQNLNYISNFLCHNNLSIPESFEHINKINDIENLQKFHLTDTLNYNHTFSKLKRILTAFNLYILPSDKTKTLVVMPRDTLFKELNIHLEDNFTYRPITNDHHNMLIIKQKETVANAMLYFNRPNLHIKNFSNRYMYFLPKTHKALTEWRNLYHPKMRPIICDTGSITHLLAKFMLPILQKIEKEMVSTVTSSLQVTYFLETINKSHVINDSTIISTVDVESLFTKIPQLKLLDIINVLITKHSPTEDYKNKYMECLSNIIQLNTFQVTDMFFLQTTGLPMGGPLSGVLANIFLGYMERNIIKFNGIISYLRYMDDIFIMSNTTNEELLQFINILKNSFSLNITSSTNRHNVTFLDMCLSVNRFHKCIEISPYSKSTPIYPIPSVITKRHYWLDRNVILSQILRTWRICNDDKKFSYGINYYLKYLEKYQYHKRLRKSIFQFLLPCKISTHVWSTNILLCKMCRNIIKENNITITKIMNINGNYIASKEPINCSTTSIHIIIHNDNNFHLIKINNLHNYLSFNKIHYSTILPITSKGDRKIINIINKYKDIKHSFILEKKKEKYPCRIHYIFKNSRKIYGVKSMQRRRRIFTSYFNEYKKISQKTLLTN